MLLCDLLSNYVVMCLLPNSFSLTDVVKSDKLVRELSLLLLQNSSRALKGLNSGISGRRSKRSRIDLISW